MADNSSGPVAVVAIIGIIILVGVAFYFITGGTFNFTSKESNTTIVQPTTAETPSSGTSTSSTTTTKTSGQ